MSKRVIITVPNLKRPGGVSALYNILRLNENSEYEYFELHSDDSGKKKSRSADLVSKLKELYQKLRHADLIHVNPSLDSKSFLRDGIILILARLTGTKMLVYWHGWQPEYQKKIEGSALLKTFFNNTYKKAHHHIVLGSVFQTQLIKFGVLKENISLESNAADNRFIVEDIISRDWNKQVPKVIFIARMEKAKGIYQAIDTVIEVAKTNPVELSIAGTGSELQNAKDYVSQTGATFIRFLDHVGGQSKHDFFKTADLLLFPTFHDEGMPISIIEGMLYGLPIVSTHVGGIPDWVEEGENGFLIDKENKSEFIDKVRLLITDRIALRRISNNNSQKGLDLFTPEKVKERIVKRYNNILSGK
jgi:glycosyltransferase involved in cell wall biosynthesis